MSLSRNSAVCLYEYRHIEIVAFLMLSLQFITLALTILTYSSLKVIEISFFPQLGAMMFKRAVYEARRRPKAIFRVKAKSSLKDIPNVIRTTFNGVSPYAVKNTLLFLLKGSIPSKHGITSLL